MKLGLRIRKLINLHGYWSRFLIIISVMITMSANAQDAEEAEDTPGEASIELLFAETDTTKTLSARVMEDTVPVEGVEIYFYVVRFFRLMSLNYGTETDEEGMASVDFPVDLIGNESGMLEVVARIEEDDTYGDVETRKKVKWGVPMNLTKEDHWGDRSLSASREKAPWYLILASNAIIAVIWGTIMYVIYLFFRIAKARKSA